MIYGVCLYLAPLSQYFKTKNAATAEAKYKLAPENISPPDHQGESGVDNVSYLNMLLFYNVISTFLLDILLNYDNPTLLSLVPYDLVADSPWWPGGLTYSGANL